MSYFWRLKTKDEYFTAIELKRNIPELKNIQVELLESYLHDSNFECYYIEQVKTSFLIRLTLPLALLVMCFLIIFMPINYIISGKWGYKNKHLTNWLRSLGF